MAMARLRLMRRRLAKGWQLPWRDKLVVLQVLLLLPAIALSLAVVGLVKTQRYLTWLLPKRANRERANRAGENPLAQSQYLARIVNRTARYSPWGNCLQRSLTLWFLLKCRGIDSDLRIGVRQQAGEFQAHAWLESDGQVINDHPHIHQTFIPFEQPFEVKL